jgi:hypothetical protein
MARDDRIASSVEGPRGTITPIARAFTVERVTRIELAWPAWKTRTVMLWLGSFLRCKEKR